MTSWAGLNNLIPALGVLPFVGFLLAIAVFPIADSTRRWWDSNTNKLKLALMAALMGVLIHVGSGHGWTRVGTTFLEYAAFLSLLGALYIISGGIHISGAYAGFPYVNTLFLGIGAVLANLLGTTGASMVLIQPLLRANRRRKHKTHIVVFFIFIVSNCGGLLTPLGDPPLYLGFLRDIPFTWTLGLTRQWLFTVGILLLVFHLLDEHIFDREDSAARRSLVSDVAGQKKRLHITGLPNLAYLAGVVAALLASGNIIYPYLTQNGGHDTAEWGSKVFQVAAFGLLTAASYFSTSPDIRKKNDFTFHPFTEVAVLFLGIFGAMIPTLTLLETQGSALTFHQPWQYFWMTGLLSGFLDNAPTYLTFTTMATSQNGLPAGAWGDLAARFPDTLAAISCGAVFMGALTYIGNGPNFMVKAIAERSGVKMPSFGRYILWSSSILIPIFILITFLFF